MRRLLRIGLVGFTVLGLVSLVEPASGQDDAALARQFAARQLATPYYQTPFDCHDGWMSSNAGYVLAVEPWAELAGLARGDRLLAFDGQKVDDSGDWDAAFRRVKRAPSFNLTVARNGRLLELQTM